MRAVVFAMLAAGCGGGGTDSHPMTSDASVSSSDAPPSQHGLHVTWNAMPPLPGMLKPDLTVTSVTFQVQRLQVIGDNGQPMTSNPMQLGWTGEGDPNEAVFPSAPSGLYSQVNLDFDGQLVGTSYEIVGTTKVMGNAKNYKIHDANSVSIDIKGFNVALSPGGDAMLAIKLDLRDAVDSVHFDMLSPDADGYLELDTADPQMQMFRDKLQDAFKKGP